MKPTNNISYKPVLFSKTDLKEKHHGRLPTSMLLLMTELEHEGKAFSRKPLITLSGQSQCVALNVYLVIMCIPLQGTMDLNYSVMSLTISFPNQYRRRRS